MIKQLLDLKNSLLFDKAVIDFTFQSTHDYTGLGFDQFRIVMSKPH